jgi:hypothetical protein
MYLNLLTSIGARGVTKRCRLFWLTYSALVYEPKCGGGGGGRTGCGFSANVYGCALGVQIYSGYLTPNLTYVCSPTDVLEKVLIRISRVRSFKRFLSQNIGLRRVEPLISPILFCPSGRKLVVLRWVVCVHFLTTAQRWQLSFSVSFLLEKLEEFLFSCEGYIFFLPSYHLSHLF